MATTVVVGGRAGQPPLYELACGALVCPARHVATIRAVLPASWLRAGTRVTPYLVRNGEAGSAAAAAAGAAAWAGAPVLAMHLSPVGAAAMERHVGARGGGGGAGGKEGGGTQQPNDTESKQEPPAVPPPPQPSPPSGVGGGVEAEDRIPSSPEPVPLELRRLLAGGTISWMYGVRVGSAACAPKERKDRRKRRHEEEHGQRGEEGTSSSASGGAGGRDASKKRLRVGVTVCESVGVTEDVAGSVERPPSSASSASSASASSSPPTPPAFRYAELFAGIGGFRVGLDALGGECVFASEIEREAADTYRANFNHTVRSSHDGYTHIGYIPSSFLNHTVRYSAGSSPHTVRSSAGSSPSYLVGNICDVDSASFPAGTSLWGVGNYVKDHEGLQGISPPSPPPPHHCFVDRHTMVPLFFSLFLPGMTFTLPLFGILHISLTPVNYTKQTQTSTSSPGGFHANRLAPLVTRLASMSPAVRNDSIILKCILGIGHED
jgi:hypothetical protein